MTRVGYPMLPSHVGMVMMIYDGFCYLPTDILGGEMKWIFSNYFCWFFENWSESTSSGREEQSVPLVKDMLVYLSRSRFFVFSLDWRAMIEMSSQRSSDNSWFFAHIRFGVKGIKKLPQHEDSLWKFIRMYEFWMWQPSIPLDEKILGFVFAGDFQDFLPRHSSPLRIRKICITLFRPTWPRKHFRKWVYIEDLICSTRPPQKERWCKVSTFPKSWILIGFSIIHHPFWGFSPYFLDRP